jgi:3-dehydroquinate synthase II
MGIDVMVRADAPDDKEKRKELVLSALESGISTMIVRPGDEDFASLGSMSLLYNDGGDVSGRMRIFELRSPRDQDEAMALAGKAEAVILGASDWTVIPLENMIAKFRGSGTKVLACASDPGQARLYLQTLERGVDGIVIDVGSGSEIRRFSDLASESEAVRLEVLEVSGVRNIEMGDRVCVDTVSMMGAGEGMLIGSSASCLFLIQAECEDNGYVAARPFRVNAGAVHAYALVPGGKTRYLSELRSGDPVALVGSDGATRVSSVGRCKIERRPLVLLEATDGRGRYSTILQNAETVKLAGPDGAVPVSAAKKGDRVYARLESGGRHFGMKIEETISEL